MILNWEPKIDDPDHYQEATIGEWPEDGVRFSMTFHPTNNIRGSHMLRIELHPLYKQTGWGTFDNEDLPIRFYHSQQRAKEEADAIAMALWEQRFRTPWPGL